LKMGITGRPGFHIDDFAKTTLVGGITGGMVSEIYGGDFGDGLQQGAITSAAGYLYNHCGKSKKQKANEHELWKKRQNGEFHKPPEYAGESPYINRLHQPLTGAEGGAYILLGASAFVTGWFAPEIYTLGVSYILTNPQQSLDFTTSVLPGTAHANSPAGAIGAEVGEILNTQKLILNP
ncbi:MAG: hypothetical protein GY699_16330, partial [Desulfobacteraceae bacterium]|nr:hypothetical protein [Desulfobacteraceae bacterium]